MRRVRGGQGRGNRVATILLDDHCRFRSNPLFHAECLLGVGTGNVIWGDYETTHYYFPVQLRDPDDSPPATALEMISRLQGPDNAPYRARLWAEFLQRYQPSVDVVLIGGSDPEVERITSAWFDRRVILGDGRVQVWSTRRRDRAGKPRR